MSPVRRRVDVPRTQTKRRIGALSTAIEYYHAQFARYPIEISSDIRSLLDNPNPDQAANWHGPSSANLLQDAWGRPFAYRCPGQHHPDSYDLYSAGPDGVLGTPDDVTNWNP